LVGGQNLLYRIYFEQIIFICLGLKIFATKGVFGVLAKPCFKKHISIFLFALLLGPLFWFLSFELGNSSAFTLTTPAEQEDYVRPGLAFFYLQQDWPSTLPAENNVLFLVNKSNSLETTYMPENLVSLSAYVPVARNDVLFKDVAAEAIKKIYLDMQKAGISDLKSTSAYRNYTYQATLYKNKIAEYRKKGYSLASATTLAEQIVVPAGTSEHQTGLALDLTTSALNGRLVEAFSETPAGEWLAENCWKYGFIIRYGADKTTLTGCVWEPWHLRFVGLPHSLYMKENSLCYEEYLAWLQSSGQYTYEAETGNVYAVYYTKNLDEFSTTNLVTEVSSDNLGGYIITTQIIPQILPGISLMDWQMLITYTVLGL